MRPRSSPATRSTPSPSRSLADEATHEDPFVRAELVAELARAAGPGGHGRRPDDGPRRRPRQTLDLAAVTRLQQLKTGALIGFCLEAGAIMGRVPPEGRTRLRGYARDVGLAFQIADDLLDEEGEEAKTGKKVGKDRAKGKETFVSLLGRERARRQAELLVDQAIELSAELWRRRRTCCAPSPASRWSGTIDGLELLSGAFRSQSDSNPSTARRGQRA